MASIVQRLRFDNSGAGCVWVAENADDPESGWSLGVGHLGCSGLTNVWLGVSVEDQAAADERISYLLNCPAAVRFVSCEPLLGAPNLSEWLWKTPHIDRSRLDWVIVGGETGPRARPMHPDWARSIRDQCQAAGVPFFFKSFGDFLGYSELYLDGIFHAPDGIRWVEGHDIFNDPDRAWRIDGDVAFDRVGKKTAGRLLDGREWDEMPGVA